MVKKFIIWFLCFGASFLIDHLGWMEQGKAFMYISLSIDIILVLLCFIYTIILCFDDSNHIEDSTLNIALKSFGTIIIALIATWGASKIFNLDFYIIYQIMTFGQCWSNTQKG